MNLGDWKVDHRIITLYLELELRKYYSYVDVDTVTPNDRTTVAKYVIHYGADEATCMHAEMVFYNIPAALRYQITLGNEQMDEAYYTHMDKDDLAHRIADMLLFLEEREVK